MKRKKDTASLAGQMDDATKVSGRTVSRMDVVFIEIKKAHRERASGEMVKK
jgi:hypothetical protein